MDTPLLLSVPNNVLAGIVAFVVLFVPLLMIPFAFSIAGGIVGRVSDFLGKQGEKLTEMIKGNPNDPTALRNKTRRNLLTGLNNARADIVRRGSGPNATPGQARRARFAGSRLFPDAYMAESDANKQATELRERLSGNGDDSEIYAGGGYTLPEGTTITPEMERTLLGYNGQRMFRGLAGTALDERMHFDAKGRRITSVLYDRSQRLRAGTDNDVAENIGYGFGKDQTDRERSAARMAFAINAQQRGWSQEQMSNMWAKAVYGKKDTDITQWYSKPEYQTNPATGQREVVFKDVGDDLGAFNAMTEELNQSRTSFAITPDRDGAMRTMLQRQEELETSAMTKGYLTDQEHIALVKTHQIFDSLGSRMFEQQPDGSITAQGTPEAQAVIKAAIDRRKLDLTRYEPGGGSRTFSIKAKGGGAVIGVRNSVTGAAMPPPPVSDAASRPNVARVVPMP